MIAIIALTKNGADVGRKIKNFFKQSDLYVSEKYKIIGQDEIIIDKKFSFLVKDIWFKYKKIIFIMATGIVVRTIAPFLKNKYEDPAVVVIDEQGKFVISLISGHLGGANAFSKLIAAKLKALPIITTASDVEGIPAFDDIARENNCQIENKEQLKKIAALMLDQEKIGCISSVKMDVPFPNWVEVLTIEESKEGTLDFKGVIYITEQEMDSLALEKPHISLRPKNLVVGVGCKKGKTKAEILEAVEKVFGEEQLSLKSISALATIELKKDEKGLIETADTLQVPLKWFTAQEISKIEDRFKCSDFVKKNVGVGAVAEPAAWLAAKEPYLLVKRRRFEGITIAIVKDLGLIISDKGEG